MKLLTTIIAGYNTNALWRESLAGWMFGEFTTLFKRLAEKSLANE